MMYVAMSWHSKKGSESPQHRHSNRAAHEYKFTKCKSSFPSWRPSIKHAINGLSRLNMNYLHEARLAMKHAETLMISFYQLILLY